VLLKPKNGGILAELLARSGTRRENYNSEAMAVACNKMIQMISACDVVIDNKRTFVIKLCGALN